LQRHITPFRRDRDGRRHLDRLFNEEFHVGFRDIFDSYLILRQWSAPDDLRLNDTRDDQFIKKRGEFQLIIY
jgi:hypothetical protein